jgi:uncharacterized protein (TIGR02246 family)
MTIRHSIALMAGLLAAGCAKDKPADQAAVPANDESAALAAIDKIHTDYVTHFNLHHASAVADLHGDSAGFFGADGSVDMGKAAILKGLEETVAAKPTITLTPAETKVFGDRAVTRGAYTFAMTPPGGAAVNVGGNYLTIFERAAGTWKIRGVVTNYSAAPPAGTPRDTTTTTPPPDAGTMKDLVASYMQHYNQGHASVVAGLYTENAHSAFADTTAAEGRAAIEAQLTKQMAQGSPQVTVHDVSTTELPGGWAIDGGWYEVKATSPQGPVNRIGVYLLLAQRQADSSWKIHWSVTNGGPAAGK